jgi:protein subunit release factor B
LNAGRAAWHNGGMSPFNVSEDKDRGLRERMTRLGVRESDLDERFVRSAGPGGQKINKTSVAVWLRHGPTGIEVRCRAERSQALNRFLARRALCDRIEARAAGARNTERAAQEKIRRQKRRRSRRQKARMLADKHAVSVKKARRAGRDWKGLDSGD